MRIELTSALINEPTWFSIVDVILLLVEERRHSISMSCLPDVLASSWLSTRSPSDRELIRRSVVARSRDSLIDRNLVVVDPAAPRGGRFDRDQRRTTLHPLDAILFLTQPFAVIVENDWYDGAFLLWMSRALGFSKFLEAYRGGRFHFRSAGGKDGLVRSAIALSSGVWAREDQRHRQAKAMWACVVLDSDARFPGDEPNHEIVAEVATHVMFVHQLQKRSIEAYLPFTALHRAAGPKAKLDALARLDPDQKAHYHMKRGFRLPENPDPSKAEFMAHVKPHPEEKRLFASLPEGEWALLRGGFGRNLSSVFSDDHERPQREDADAISPADRIEILELIKTIYGIL